MPCHAMLPNPNRDHKHTYTHYAQNLLFFHLHIAYHLSYLLDSLATIEFGLPFDRSLTELPVR